MKVVILSYCIGLFTGVVFTLLFRVEYKITRWKTVRIAMLNEKKLGEQMRQREQLKQEQSPGVSQ